MEVEQVKEKGKKLFTLQQFNERAIEIFNLSHDKPLSKNGIECPICNNELLDSNFGYELNAGLMTKKVLCDNYNCGYEGFRFLLN